MPVDIRTHLQNIDRIKAVLVAAQEQCNNEQAVLYDEADCRYSSEWVLFERREVLKEVNAIRAARGRPPIDERTLLRRAEYQATGHCDYTGKFALYAAELAEEADDATR